MPKRKGAAISREGIGQFSNGKCLWGGLLCMGVGRSIYALFNKLQFFEKEFITVLRLKELKNGVYRPRSLFHYHRHDFQLCFSTSDSYYSFHFKMFLNRTVAFAGHLWV